MIFSWLFFMWEGKFKNSLPFLHVGREISQKKFFSYPFPSLRDHPITRILSLKANFFFRIQFYSFEMTILFIERNEMRFAKLADSNNYKEWSWNLRNALCETKLWRIVIDEIIRFDDNFSSNFTFAERKKNAEKLL